MTSLQSIAKKKEGNRNIVCFDVGMTSSLRTPSHNDMIFQYQQFLLRGFGLPLNTRASGDLVVMGSKSAKPGAEHVGGRHDYHSVRTNSVDAKDIYLCW
jgi:hypothetical protein